MALYNDQPAPRRALCRRIGRHAAAGDHKQGIPPGFTSRYGLTRLVYYEWHDRIIDAIQREKNIKHWKRSWKVELIESMNPNWDDLYETLNA